MLTDVIGRVRNISLAASKPLLPLYEAIVNSIQAIEDAEVTDRRIDITIVRDQHHLLANVDKSLGNIDSFCVKDNGIGFTDPNYYAFQTSDTTYKAKRGGKGIGRFLWLVAFEEVKVESHYFDQETLKQRRFAFVPLGDGIKDSAVVLSDQKSRGTTVTLTGFKDKYQRQCPRRLDTIGAHIIEHCLEYFIRASCPTMCLHDSGTGESIILNEMFERDMAAKSGTAEFHVGRNKFCILHVRLYSPHIKDHLAHYCANDRVVTSEKLGGRIPNLARRLLDENGKEFIYAAYVESDLLDSAVNSERTTFSISDNSDNLLSEDTTWVDIQDAVRNQCRDFLVPYTGPILKNKLKRIDDFVAKEAPMYRPIMKHITDKVEMIDPEVSDGDLDIRLYEAYQALQAKVKSEGQRLFQNDIVKDEDFEGYRKRFGEYFDKVNDINAADLARYVCHRKAILDFLQKQLSIADDGKYSKEDRVHNIIFPQGQTSDDVLPSAHNLWLIDEKLVYHKFLASDKKLRSMDPISSPSLKEPDIIVFDKACAFTPSEDPPFPAVVIVEFKRPMRNDYTQDKNPFVQVREYIEDIRAGKARTPDGREVPVLPNVPFYCYIVCDPTETLVKQAKDFELEQTPDGLGFFGFKRHYHAYFEVISYTKMLTDAKKRNAVLFNTLGLPSQIS